MAREKMILDDEAINQEEKIIVPKQPTTVESTTTNVVRYSEANEDLINCLTNERVNVKFISKARGAINDPKHVLFGGMAEASTIQITTPLLRSGVYTDVLTKEEKKYLEYALGLEPNALNVYNKRDNFWDCNNPQGIGFVSLKKGDNFFDKSDPIDYIRLKVVLAHRDLVAPSILALQDSPKATYKFVAINESDSVKSANNKVTLKAQAYKEFGKIEDNKEKLRTIIEIIDGRPTAANTKLEYLQGKLGELLETNTKLFLSIVKDPLLDNKVLIKKAIEAGIIANRGNYLYYKADNTPLCGSGQEPTLNTAAKFLSLPKQQELKLSIEAKLK